jgi:hypothetical protein
MHGKATQVVLIRAFFIPSPGHRTDTARSNGMDSYNLVLKYIDDELARMYSCSARSEFYNAANTS